MAFRGTEVSFRSGLRKTTCQVLLNVTPEELLEVAYKAEMHWYLTGEECPARGVVDRDVKDQMLRPNLAVI